MPLLSGYFGGSMFLDFLKVNSQSISVKNVSSNTVRVAAKVKGNNEFRRKFRVIDYEQQLIVLVKQTQTVKLFR